MTAGGVEPHLHVMQTGLAEGVVRARDALAVLADRIGVAGHEVYRRLLAHLVDVRLVGDEFYAAHHIAEQADRRHKAAERIGDIFVNILRVAAEPVKISARVGIALVV